MLHKIVSGLSLILVLSCSSTKRSGKPEVIENREQLTRTTARPTKKTIPAVKRTKGTEAVWHLIAPLGIVFILTHDWDGRQEVILVSTTLSSIKLPPGDWMVSGFIWEGKKYVSQPGFPIFQFHLEKNTSNYIGSYLMECPLVSSRHLNSLRKMKFFNRYHFISDDDHCELVVGHDLENVARAWSKLVNSPASDLRPAF